jgi:hypothetical protein
MPGDDPVDAIVKHAIELAEGRPPSDPGASPGTQLHRADYRRVAPDFLPCRDGGVISVTARRSSADHFLR